jgi:hypothetical protein
VVGCTVNGSVTVRIAVVRAVSTDNKVASRLGKPVRCCQIGCGSPSGHRLFDLVEAGAHLCRPGYGSRRFRCWCRCAANEHQRQYDNGSGGSDGNE